MRGEGPVLQVVLGRDRIEELLGRAAIRNRAGRPPTTACAISGSWSWPRQPLTPPPPRPPGRGGNRSGRVALGAAAAAVGGVAVVLVAVLGPDHSAHRVDPGASTVESERLLAALPAGFGVANCAPVEGLRARLGALAAVRCASGPAGGPETATFTRFADRTRLDAAFDEMAAGESIPSAPGRLSDCRTAAVLRTTYARGADAHEGGSVACYTEPGTGASCLLWTDDDALTLGWVRHSGRAALYDWWQRIDLAR